MNFIKDKVVEMDFPVEGDGKDRDAIVRALLERKEEVQKTFSNNEFIKLDLTNQQLLGIKSTANIGDLVVGDRPALNYVIANSEKHRESNLIDIGNIDKIYKHYVT